MLPQIQVPDIGASIARAEAMQGSRLQQLAAMQGMDDARRLQGVLGEVGPALFGTDPEAQRLSLQRLITEGGPQAFPIAATIQGQQAAAADRAAEREFRERQARIAAGNANRPQFTYQVGEDGQVYALNSRNPTAAPIPTGFRPQGTQRGPMVVAPGATVLGPNGQPIFQAPDRPREDLETWRPVSPEERQQFGLPADMPAQISSRGQVRQVGGGGVTVNNSGENAFARETGTTLAKRTQEIDQGGARAVRQLNNLGRVEAALNAFETGAAANARLTVGRFAQMLGIPDSALPQGINKDAVASGEFIASQAARSLVDMIGAGGFPAQNFSNADREMLERAIFNLSASPNGNRLIIAAMRRGAETDRNVANAWREWQRENGASQESAERFFRDRVPQIVTEDPYAELIAAASGQQAARRDPLGLFR